MTPGAILKLNQAIKRNDFKVINIPYKDSTNTSVAKRLEMYREAAGEDRIKAYVNVGGNMASIGLKQPKVKDSDKKSKKDEKPTTKSTDEQILKLHSFLTGVTTKLPPEYSTVNSVAVNFLKDDIPVVNVRDISSSIIKTYGMTYNPTIIVPPGQGAVFSQKKYNTTLAAALLIIDIALIAFMAFVSRKYLISFKSK